jgi:hypothetical protein
VDGVNLSVTKRLMWMSVSPSAVAKDCPTKDVGIPDGLAVDAEGGA